MNINSQKAQKITKKYRLSAHHAQSDSEAKDNLLEEQVHLLQTLIDAIPSPIFYKDMSATYRGCNKAFEAYLGLSKHQIVGKGVYDIAPLELADKYHQMDMQLLQTSGIQVYESHVVYADGSEHDVIFNKATYTTTDNQVVGLVGIINDVTKQKKTERELHKSSDKLQTVVEQIVQTMAAITETRDMYTAGHQKRVSELGVAIATELTLAEDVIKSVQVAGMLHDIGKIAIPAEILTKPAKLTFHEYGIVKGHAEVGYNILRKIDFPWPIAQIVYQHHERADGSGYPNNLRGDKTLIQAQIIAVADVVEAMSSHRPYRPSLGIVKAITEISSNRDILYNPDVVEACLRVFETGRFWKTKQSFDTNDATER